MKVLVIGCGLMGITTAYFLRRAGYEVTVLDREAEPARGASFANGALLTASMAEPWNTPGIWRVLLGSIVRPNPALQLRLRVLPSLAGWGVRFLHHCQAQRFTAHAASNLRLALHSIELMHALARETGMEYGQAAGGTLRIFRDAASLERAFTATAHLGAQGLAIRRLSRDETMEQEPALEPIAAQMAGAIHYATDETGDARRFCLALAQYVQQAGVELRLQTKIQSFECQANRVVAARGHDNRFVADQYVVAAGCESAPLLRPMGIHLPVQPVKGYSLTFDCAAGVQSLRRPVIDDGLHAAVVPLEGALRVAGTAEFAGFDRAIDPVRVRDLTRLLRKILPRQAAQLEGSPARAWCGLRAVSADGVPLIGATSLENLYVNTGQGHLGWTMAAGSAQLLAAIMSGASSHVDPAPYAPARFSGLHK